MINYLNSTAQHWFDWQFAMLWQTAVLIPIIWLIDVLIRKWAHPQVRYALWMLILVKLLIPPTWTSPASVTSNIPSVTQKALTSLNSPPVWPEHPASDQNTHSATTDLDQIKSGPKGQDTVAGGATCGMADSSQSSLSGATQPKQNLHWQVYAMFTWLAGILVLSFWLIVRLSGLRREHLNDSTAALPERFHIQLQEVAQKLNLKRIPRVVLTDKVACPAVFGIFKPVLLMPAAKFKTMTRQDTEHILLHELAHIKRGDLLVHAVYMIAQIAYWFNPLIWMARRPMQNLRELCCDATVAKLLRDKTVHYRQTLLETARQLLAEPVDPGLGLLGLFENNNWLVTRLQWLEKNTWKNRPLRIATIITLVAVMTTCVLPMANRQKPVVSSQKSEFTATLDNGVSVEVLGVCDHPSEGKQWWRADGMPFNPDFYTQTKGQVSASGKPYEIAVKVDGPEDLSFTWKQVKGAAGSSSFYVQDKEGNDIDNIKASKFIINPKLDSTHIELGVAAGKWTTLFTHNGHGTMSSGREKHGIAFSKAYQMDNDIEMTVSDDYFDADYRLIAIGKNGDIHTTNNRNSNSGGKVRQSTFKFRNLNLDDIKEFQFQTRPYEWVTFKNVALRPIWKQEKAIKLLEILRTAKGPKRKDAAEKLVKYGRSVVPAITEMLEDDNVWAAYALGEIGPEAEDAVPALISSLTQGGGGGIRGSSAAALGKIGPAAVSAIPALVETLNDKDEDWNARMHAASSLGSLSTGQKEVIEALTAASQDENQEVQKEATRALKKIEQKSTISELSTPNSQNYSATLPNGVTLELVGTCQYIKSGPQCYRPDGVPLGRNLKIKKWNRNPKTGDVGLMLKLDGPDGIKLSYHGFEGSKGWEGSCQVVDENGQTLKGWQAALTQFDPDQEATTCKFGIASGTWKTVARNDGKRIGIDNNISFTKANETTEGVQVFTTDTLGQDIDHRIVAIDTNGKLHPWKGHTGSVRRNDLRQSIATFPDLKLDQIKEFQFQTRSYEYVTFKNVALRPAVKTEVEIEIDDGQSTKDEGAEAWSGSDTIGAHDILEIPSFAQHVNVLFSELKKAYTAKDWQLVNKIAENIRDVFRDNQELFVKKFGKDTTDQLENLSDELHDSIRDEKLYLAPAYYQEFIKTWDEVLKNKQLLHPIDFEITRQDFQQGDSIEITSLLGTSDKIEVGQTYTVTGKYTLSSQDAAMLHIYATNGETQSQQGPLVNRGSGEFTRTFTYQKEGWLHLSFYPANGGSSFGGVYFAQQGSNQQVPDMSQITSFTKTTVVSTGDPITQNSKLKTKNSTSPSSGEVDLTPADFKLRYHDKQKTYDLLVMIENNGDIPLPRHRIRYYRGNPKGDLDETGNPHSGWHNAGPIEPGKTWNERTRDFFLPDGDYTFTVVLDYNNAIAETNETNNTATLSVTIQNGQIKNQPSAPSPQPSEEKVKTVSSKEKAHSEDKVIIAENYVADLPIAGKIELVAVCQFFKNDNKVEQQCWSPDGSKIEVPIYTRKPHSRESQTRTGFIFRSSKRVERRFWDIEGFDKDSVSGDSTAFDENGGSIRERNYFTFTGVMDQRDFTDIKLRIQPHSWKTVAEYDGKYSVGKVDKRIRFIEAYDSDDGVKLVFECDIENVETRIVAEYVYFDEQNNRSRDKWTSGRPETALDANGDKLSMAVFRDLKLADIKLFRFETRPKEYEWVTFKNVALHPNENMDR